MEHQPRSKIVIFLFIAILMMSCSKQLWTTEGGIRPKKYKFLFAKKDFLLEANDKIDTTVLYLEIDRSMALSHDKVGNTYQFYRFYQNGRLQISETYENFEDHHKLQNINTGIIGYYKLVGDTLRCEFFSPTEAGQYVYIDGSIENGIIVLTKMYPRHVGPIIKSRDTLIRTTIKAIPITPNW